MPLLLALALLVQPHGESVSEEVTPGVVCDRNAATEAVTVDLPGDRRQAFSLAQCGPRWHLDPGVELPPWAAREGCRVLVVRRVTKRDGRVTQCNTTLRLVTLGPLTKHAEDVERAIQSVGGRLDPELVGRENLATIEALGSASFLVRESTTDALRRQGIGALDVLLFARHSRDREVRTRAEMLLRPLGWEG